MEMKSCFCSNQLVLLMKSSKGCRTRLIIEMLLLMGGIESNPGPIEEEVLEIAALGRPFHLGMLYDARSDKTIPAVTLWDNETLHSHVDKGENQNVKVEIIENDTISDKTTALNVRAELKLSFLCGLIELSGSGGYLKDFCDNSTQERITLQYKSTSHWEKLGMNHISKDKMQHLHVFEHKTATHVVTQIQYGADAFFLFDRQKRALTDKMEVGGSFSLKAEVNAIKTIASAGALAEIKGVTETKDKSENTHCTYYGDFSLPHYPTNIQEARKAVHHISEQLQSKPVPKTIWLYPLSLLDDKATKLLARISINLLLETEQQLQALIDTKMTISGMVELPEVQRFGALKIELMDYKKFVTHSELLFQEKTRNILPKIRGGTSQESELAKVLKTWNYSVFSPDKMNQAVHDFKDELNWLKERTEKIEKLEIEILKSSDEISGDLEGHSKAVLALEFNIAEFRSGLNDRCREFLDNPSESTEAEETTGWYNDSELRAKSARNISTFLSFVMSARKHQSIVSKEGLPPARFVCVPNKPKNVRKKQKSGSPVSIVTYSHWTGTETELPFFNYPPIVTNLTSNSAEISIQLPSMGLENIKSVFVLAKEGKNEYKILKKQKRDNDGETKMNVVVAGLLPSSSYFFKVQPLTLWGLGPESSASSRAETARKAEDAGLEKKEESDVDDGDGGGDHDDVDVNIRNGDQEDKQLQTQVSTIDLGVLQPEAKKNAEDEWVTVQHGAAFPQDLDGCIRAFDLPGLDGQVSSHPDVYAYIALWMPPDGEAAFGCTWNELGKVKARFSHSGKIASSEEVTEFRILKTGGKDPKRYSWVTAKEAYHHSLVDVDGYTPAMVSGSLCMAKCVSSGKKILNIRKLSGKPHWKVWMCEDGKECECKTDHLPECYLLAKTQKDTEDEWLTVQHGSDFPQNLDGCVRAHCIPVSGEKVMRHPDPIAYIALWQRSEGEAVFGCAWNELGKVKARFTHGGKLAKSKEVTEFRILKVSGDASEKYRWVQASEANEHLLLQIRECTPAVVFHGANEAIGKAKWANKSAWICENNQEDNSEVLHEGDKFAECFLLTKVL